MAAKPIGLAALDAMIERAEAARDRGTAKANGQRSRYSLMQRARQQAMEDALARLRAQREQIAP